MGKTKAETSASDLDKPILLADAAALFPVPVDMQALRRWASHGVTQTGGGPRPLVKLATIRVGNRRYTTQRSVNKFLEECNNDGKADN
jgi:hypothetical protein